MINHDKLEVLSLPRLNFNAALEMILWVQFLSFLGPVKKLAVIWVFHNFIPSKAYKGKVVGGTV